MITILNNLCCSEGCGFKSYKTMPHNVLVEKEGPSPNPRSRKEKKVSGFRKKSCDQLDILLKTIAVCYLTNSVNAYCCCAAT